LIGNIYNLEGHSSLSIFFIPSDFHDHINNGAWRYIQPSPNFESIQEYYSFYPSLMDACYVNDELVKAQTGDFYGGWITSDIVGPFKGEPGTMWW
jgi:hypothetical protein